MIHIYYKKVGISYMLFFKKLIPSIFFFKFSGYFDFKPLILVGEIKKTIIWKVKNKSNINKEIKFYALTFTSARHL